MRFALGHHRGRVGGLNTSRAGLLCAKGRGAVTVLQRCSERTFRGAVWSGVGGVGKVWARLKWIGRILRSLATGSEDSKSYPEKAIAVLWNRLPGGMRSWKATRTVGRLIHRRALRVQQRGGGNYTCFFRNLPQLELLRDLALEMPQGVPVKIAVLGCSTGAELYSAVWMMRTARPEQKVEALGIDISEACIQAAANGVYPLQATEVAWISETSYERLFTRQEDALSVQEWLREGIRWRVGDVCSLDLAAHFGLHHAVFANNFLFQMSPGRAEACLRNVARLVAPNGHLFVRGVDLDVRSRAVRALGLIPVTARLEDIHTAEEGMLAAWPLSFWGLEPIDRTRQDWPAHYTTVFRSPHSSACTRARSREWTAERSVGVGA
jgi:SAM-dependent methyltransferase